MGKEPRKGRRPMKTNRAKTNEELNDEIERLHDLEIENEPFGDGKYHADTVIDGLVKFSRLDRETCERMVKRFFGV
jgi:hypothetical protein